MMKGLIKLLVMDFDKKSQTYLLIQREMKTYNVIYLMSVDKTILGIKVCINESMLD